MTRPLFLVTNDDGISAPGLQVLADAVEPFGDVFVCAPDSEQSGASHAITLHSHLRADEIRPRWFKVSGTPVDTVYIGMLHLCPRAPTIVVSGINNGYNLGSDVIYSGTVGAAREGRLRGASGLAVSVDRGADPLLAASSIQTLIPSILELHEQGAPQFINLNVPNRSGDELGEPRMCSLGERRYDDQVDERLDLQGRPYYWIGGPPAEYDTVPGTDVHMVRDGHPAVTALSIDIAEHDTHDWDGRIRRE